MVKQAKIDAVASLTEKLERAKSVILTDYRGLTVEDMVDLRTRCRDAQVEYRVIKNRLLKIALKNAEYVTIDEQLTGPVGVAFSYDDPAQGAKIVAGYAKENENLEIKCGLMDKELIDIETVLRLSRLPSKEVVYASIAVGINGSTTGIATTINAIIQKIAIAIQEVAKQKEQPA